MGDNMNKPIFINSILTVKPSTIKVAKAAKQEVDDNELTPDMAKKLIAEIFKKDGKSNIQSA